MDKKEIFETVMDVVATAALMEPAFDLFINDEIVDGLRTPRQIADFLTQRLNQGGGEKRP